MFAGSICLGSAQPSSADQVPLSYEIGKVDYPGSPALTVRVYKLANSISQRFIGTAAEYTLCICMSQL
jgi:hypothetical protein